VQILQISDFSILVGVQAYGSVEQPRS